MIKLSTIKVNPKNPRIIKDDKFKKLVKSIQDFPEMMNKRPLVCVTDVDGKLYTLGGNMRLKALQELKYKEIPDTWVMLADDWTEEKRNEFTIKDNVGFGEWDFDMLANDWDVEQLNDWGLDLPTEWGAEPLQAKEDGYEIPDEIETDIVLGDLFEIGEHRLLCGDSTDSDMVERLMKGEKADMVFTDPPYDLQDTYSQNIFNVAKDDHCHIFIMNSDRILIDNINNGINWFRKIFAVDFRQARLVSNNQPMTRVDLIAEFCKGKTKFRNQNDAFTTLIECAKIHSDNVDKNFGHKQAKSPELPAKFITHYSDQNDLIVDLFGGSGSTMAAAQQLRRKCYMMEFSPQNCQIILNRMEKCYNITSKKTSNVLETR